MYIEIFAIFIAILITNYRINHMAKREIRIETVIKYEPCEVLYLCLECGRALKENDLKDATVKMTDQEGDRIYGTKTIKVCKCGKDRLKKIKVIKDEVI